MLEPVLDTKAYKCVLFATVMKNLDEEDKNLLKRAWENTGKYCNFAEFVLKNVDVKVHKL